MSVFYVSLLGTANTNPLLPSVVIKDFEMPDAAFRCIRMQEFLERTKADVFGVR